MRKIFSLAAISAAALLTACGGGDEPAAAVEGPDQTSAARAEVRQILTDDMAADLRAVGGASLVPSAMTADSVGLPAGESLLPLSVVKMLTPADTAQLTPNESAMTHRHFCAISTASLAAMPAPARAVAMFGQHPFLTGPGMTYVQQKKGACTDAARLELITPEMLTGGATVSDLLSGVPAAVFAGRPDLLCKFAPAMRTYQRQELGADSACAAH